MNPERGSDGTPKDGDVTDRGQRFAVTVRVDDRELPLKLFLHDMIGGSIVGLLSGLRDAEARRRIEIEVRKL